MLTVTNTGKLVTVTLKSKNLIFSSQDRLATTAIHNVVCSLVGKTFNKYIGSPVSAQLAMVGKEKGVCSYIDDHLRLALRDGLNVNVIALGDFNRRYKIPYEKNLWDTVSDLHTVSGILVYDADDIGTIKFGLDFLKTDKCTKTIEPFLAYYNNAQNSIIDVCRCPSLRSLRKQVDYWMRSYILNTYLLRETE